jgi:hypothetical protein
MLPFSLANSPASVNFKAQQQQQQQQQQLQGQAHSPAFVNFKAQQQQQQQQQGQSRNTPGPRQVRNLENSMSAEYVIGRCYFGSRLLDRLVVTQSL